MLTSEMKQLQQLLLYINIKVQSGKSYKNVKMHIQLRNANNVMKVKTVAIPRPKCMHVCP